MKHLFFSIILLLTLFLTGCGESAYNMFTHEESYYKNLEHSSKGEIRDNLATKAIFSATYLTPLYDEYSSSEAFLVGIYIPDDYKEKEKQGVNNPFYQITLNGIDYFKTKELKTGEKILKESPMVDRWSRYYIVEFKKQKSQKLFLKFFNTETKKDLILSFQTHSQK